MKSCYLILIASLCNGSAMAQPASDSSLSAETMRNREDLLRRR